MTIVTTTMNTEIQNRINALVSPVSPKDILKHAVDSKGLGLDLTNLETVLNTAITQVNGSTTESDLIALNAARIAIESNSMSPNVLPKLAPDLTFPSSLSAGIGYSIISNINATSGLTTALSLTGKFAVSLLYFFNMTSGDTVTVKLTVDGDVKWNDTFVNNSTNLRLLGSVNTNGTDTATDVAIMCESSLLLEVQCSTDTSINLNQLARPIL